MTNYSTLFTLRGSLHFDIVSGVELCGGDPDIYNDLSHEFPDNILPLGTTLLDGIVFQKQPSCVHWLKVAHTTLGARRPSGTALAVEISLRHGTPDACHARRLLQDIERMRQLPSTGLVQ